MTVLRILGVLAAVVFMVIPANAQTDGTACAAIAADAERLACYDAIFRTNGAAEPAASVQPVTLESQQLLPAHPGGRAPATMSFACEEGELTLRFRFAGNRLSATGSNTGISFTRDLSGDRVMTLPPSPDGTELIMRPASSVLSFLDWLSGATNVSVRVTPADFRTFSVRFRIAEIEEQLAPLLAACS